MIMLEDIANEIFHADHPGNLSKYDLRKWVVGEAVCSGWAFELVQFSDHDPIYRLTKDDCTIDLRYTMFGLTMNCDGRKQLIETEK